MIKKSIVGLFVLMVTIFFASENSFAQGPLCIYGVGNCERTGDRYTFEGALAADIMAKLNYGARYLVRMSSTPDPNRRGCNIEARAWISKVEANNGNKISVLVGPSRNVQICPGATIPTVEQINDAEAWIQYSRKMIYDWQVYQRQVTGNPGEYQRATAWINHFDQYIRQQQSLIAPVTP